MIVPRTLGRTWGTRPVLLLIKSCYDTDSLGTEYRLRGSLEPQASRSEATMLEDGIAVISGVTNPGG